MNATYGPMEQRSSLESNTFTNIKNNFPFRKKLIFDPLTFGFGRDHWSSWLLEIGNFKAEIEVGKLNLNLSEQLARWAARGKCCSWSKGSPWDDLV